MTYNYPKLSKKEAKKAVTLEKRNKRKFQLNKDFINEK